MKRRTRAGEAEEVSGGKWWPKWLKNSTPASAWPPPGSISRWRKMRALKRLYVLPNLTP